MTLGWLVTLEDTGQKQAKLLLSIAITIITTTTVLREAVGYQYSELRVRSGDPPNLYCTSGD